MKIGIPKELKNNEYRVGLSPSSVVSLVNQGNSVYIQSSAGEGSGFSDKDYKKAGASIVFSIEEIYKSCDMIVKVKEPVPNEYELIRKGQLLFTYFHFASDERLTKKMIEREAICLAYETVEKTKDKSLPLLTPMSEVAGRMATQQGAKYLERPQQGRGILLGGVPGVLPAKVLIIGGGVVGTQAAKMAAGLGALVTILDLSLDRLRYLSDTMPENVNTMISNEYNILSEIREADLIIGAVLIPGSKAPKLIKREMLKMMKKGTVIVDVAVDQGGCIETCTPTTHENPTFIIDDIVHYCVANMPGAVPHTSTIALNNATLPYCMALAKKGWKKACQDDIELKKGLNIVEGKIVYKAVADAFGLDYTPIEKIL